GSVRVAAHRSSLRVTRQAILCGHRRSPRPAPSAQPLRNPCAAMLQSISPAGLLPELHAPVETGHHTVLFQSRARAPPPQRPPSQMARNRCHSTATLLLTALKPQSISPAEPSSLYM